MIRLYLTAASSSQLHQFKQTMTRVTCSSDQVERWKRLVAGGFPRDRNQAGGLQRLIASSSLTTNQYARRVFLRVVTRRLNCWRSLCVRAEANASSRMRRSRRSSLVTGNTKFDIQTKSLLWCFILQINPASTFDDLLSRMWWWENSLRCICT